MAELTDEAKHEIVRRLARFEKPGEVAKAIGLEFFDDARAVSQPQVSQLNPGIASFQGSQKWVYVFDAERERYRKDLEAHDATDRGWRIGMLQRMAEKAETMGNLVTAAALLEQIAKEIGDVFTNRTKHDHSGKVTHDHRLPDTAAEARRELQMRLDNLRQIGSSQTDAAKAAE